MCHCDRATFRATKASCQHSGLISWLKVIAAFALTRFCWRRLRNFPGTKHLDFNTGDAKAPIKNYILTEERGTYFFSHLFGLSPSSKPFCTRVCRKGKAEQATRSDGRQERHQISLKEPTFAHFLLCGETQTPVCLRRYGTERTNCIELGWKGDI